ncbi:cyclin-like protein [Xylona heveae TC161]|uniref:RNA polymerase II holoenzyme cyclin-like subunit n=1 Tax=Xylona heveae (strain CBS 132557 / TC161) TaxID=1328760 RepID=A0A165HE18_XYLHT|nr:cyclin-like protein [Xylona heveae TC161]KZF23369.1 cyclin-like protein [Xylona heveae TC161]
MAPSMPLVHNDEAVIPRPGPHPSFIQVAKPYMFEQEIEGCMRATGVNEAKEDTLRLQGVAWIDSVRKTLQLPVRTFNTAVVYYHKFRLVHADNEYSFVDAAAAALFTACKIEDTLKKSKEILCGAYNMKLSPAERLSPDDPLFENPSKLIIGLERLMLEASSFDYRNRYPQKLLLKLVKLYGFDKETVGKMAYNMSLDLYRTFAPLKQSTSTLALACIELSARILDVPLGKLEDAEIYGNWSTSREQVMETLLDLLELYTHHRGSTVVGPEYSIETFITIRITLNQESASHHYPRFTEWNSHKPETNGAEADVRNGTKESRDGRDTTNSQHGSPPAMGPVSALGTRGRVGERSRDGTVRFMLDAERAREEQVQVAEYFKVEEEEYEVEVEIDRGRGRERERERDRDRDRDNGRERRRI